MIIKTLAEDQALSEAFGSEHGLSFYIESGGRKILFDTGASGLFAENARKLGVPLEEVQYLFISHGHNDHGGGLETFLKLNQKAKVYIHPLAFEKHYSKKKDGSFRYNGLDGRLKAHPRLNFCEGLNEIAPGLWLFSDVPERTPRPYCNRSLFAEHGGRFVPDLFSHEQNLLISEAGKKILLVGCAHSGIVNIMAEFRELFGTFPDEVIGGFHLARGSAGRESKASVAKTAAYLDRAGARYYTCHCSGEEPYRELKAVLGDRIRRVSAGSVFEL